MEYTFESDRLGFREWTEADKAPFGKMNANKESNEVLSKAHDTSRVRWSGRTHKPTF